MTEKKHAAPSGLLSGSRWRRHQDGLLPRRRHRRSSRAGDRRTFQSFARRIRQGLVCAERCGRRGAGTPAPESRRHPRNLRRDWRRRTRIRRAAHRHISGARLSEATVSITTDLAITLHAAVGDKEGIILVVGTGSGAYGRDAKGHTARAGGRGPWFSDEGSGFDIGRRALAAVVRAEEKRGPQTALSQKVLTWLGCNDWTRVLDWVVKNPDDVFPRVFPLVAELGDQGDAVAREILSQRGGVTGGPRRERDRSTPPQRPRNSHR